MKNIWILFLVFSLQTLVYPQNKLQNLWTILDNEDTTALSQFFNDWYKESTPITDFERSKLSPLLISTYEIFECIYKPFQLPNIKTELDSNESRIPYVILPTNFTVSIWDSLYFDSKNSQQNWNDLIIEEQTFSDFRPRLFNTDKKLLLLNNISFLVDTAIEISKQEYFDRKASVLSKYLIIEKGYRFALTKYRINIASYPFPTRINFNEALDFATVYFSTSRYSGSEIPFKKENNCWVVDKSKQQKIIMY